MNNSDRRSFHFETVANIDHPVRIVEQVALHLHETGLKEEVLDRSRMSQEEVLLRKEKVILDVQAPDLLPDACLDQVLEHSELGALCVDRHEIDYILCAQSVTRCILQSTVLHCTLLYCGIVELRALILLASISITL